MVSTPLPVAGPYPCPLLIVRFVNRQYLASAEHLRPEEQRQSGGIAICSGGIVSSGDERTADAAASRPWQRKVKRVLIFGVLGADSVSQRRARRVQLVRHAAARSLRPSGLQGECADY